MSMPLDVLRKRSCSLCTGGLVANHFGHFHITHHLAFCSEASLRICWGLMHMDATGLRWTHRVQFQLVYLTTSVFGIFTCASGNVQGMAMSVNHGGPHWTVSMTIAMKFSIAFKESWCSTDFSSRFRVKYLWWIVGDLGSSNFFPD